MRIGFALWSHNDVVSYGDRTSCYNDCESMPYCRTVEYSPPDRKCTLTSVTTFLQTLIVKQAKDMRERTCGETQFLSYRYIHHIPRGEGGTCMAPLSTDIPKCLTTFPLIYELVSLHMCVLPCTHREMLEMLLHLKKLCETMGNRHAPSGATYMVHVGDRGVARGQGRAAGSRRRRRTTQQRAGACGRITQT